MLRALTILSLLLPLAFGNIFNQFFGGQQQQQAPQFNYRQSRAEIQSGELFLCPTTLTSVRDPKDCECPSEQDLKCQLGDTYVCSKNCEVVSKAFQPI